MLDNASDFLKKTHMIVQACHKVDQRKRLRKQLQARSNSNHSLPYLFKFSARAIFCAAKVLNTAWVSFWVFSQFFQKPIHFFPIFYNQILFLSL